ncbi:ankyrin repeat-containing domain protein, partial [Hysterangium stoloniferum]
LRKDIDEWLSAPNPSKTLNTAQEERMENTGSWFLNSRQFIQWKEGVNQCLWLKIALRCSSSIVINVQELCVNNPSRAVVYFFFDSRDSQENFQSYHKLIRSLIKQLLLICFDAPKVLLQIFKFNKNGAEEPSLGSLQRVFSDLLTMFEDVYIILDALDECSEHSQVITWIKGLLTQNDSKIHILVTVRPDISSRGEMDELNTERLFLHNAENNDDITTYIRGSLQSQAFSSFSLSLQNDIFTTLNNGADGMFRWVALQLKGLSDCDSVFDLREQLGRLPATLSETYERIILKIPERKQKDVLKFLQWLAFSFEPLKVKELAQITGINMDYVVGDSKPPFNHEAVYKNPTNLLNVCAGLVVQSAGGDYINIPFVGTVKLAHFSVKEYLMMDTSSGGPPPSLHLEAQLAHTNITKMCLVYLLQFQDTLMPSVTHEQDLKDQYPLKTYSSRHWVFHAKAGRDDSLDKYHSLIMKLFEKGSQQFRLWDKHDWRKLGPPVHVAAYYGLHGVIEALLNGGADPNVEAGDDNGTALTAAASEGHMEVLEVLLAHGADPNVQASEHGTALTAAASGGHVEVIKVLLAHGVDPNIQAGFQGTALTAAALRGHMEVIKVLLAHGADPNVQESPHETALTAAASQGHTEVVEVLLTHHADPNVQAGLYGTALNAAALEGHRELIEVLLAHGADPNIQAGDDGTALAAAASGSHMEVLEVLLAHGADLNVQAGQYGTALVAAATRGHLGVLQVLLAHGADPNVQAFGYGTALTAAAVEGHLEVLEILLAHGADPNVQAGDEVMALIAAAVKNHLDKVESLLPHGVDPNIRAGPYGQHLQGEH